MRRTKTVAVLAVSMLLLFSAPALGSMAWPQDNEKIQRAAPLNGAPEIHPSLWTGGLLLLIGGTLILVARHRRTRSA